MAVHVMRALLFGVYIRARDFWKLPYAKTLGIMDDRTVDIIWVHARLLPSAIVTQTLMHLFDGTGVFKEGKQLGVLTQACYRSNAL